HTRFSRDWSSDVCSSDLFQRGALRRGQPALEIIKKLVGIHYSGTWKASRYRSLHAMMKSKVGVEPVICSLRRRQYNRCSGRKRRSEERRVGKEWRERGTG